MKCSSIEQLIQKIADKELPAKYAVQVKEHLSACPACAEKLNGLLKLKSTIHALSRHTVKPALAERIMALIEGSFIIPNWLYIVRFLKLWIPVSLALSITAALMFVFKLKNENNIKEKPQMENIVLETDLKQDSMERTTFNIVIYNVLKPY